jgi:hypothetical protein
MVSAPPRLHLQLVDDEPMDSRQRSTINTSAASVTSRITHGTLCQSQLPLTSFPAQVAHVLKIRNELLAGTSSIPVSSAIVSRAQSLITPCLSFTSRTFDEAIASAAAFSVTRERCPSNLQARVKLPSPQCEKDFCQTFGRDNSVLPLQPSISSSLPSMHAMPPQRFPTGSRTPPSHSEPHRIPNSKERSPSVD